MKWLNYQFYTEVATFNLNFMKGFQIKKRNKKFNLISNMYVYICKCMHGIFLIQQMQTSPLSIHLSRNLSPTCKIFLIVIFCTEHKQTTLKVISGPIYFLSKQKINGYNRSIFGYQNTSLVPKLTIKLQ